MAKPQTFMNNSGIAIKKLLSTDNTFGTTASDMLLGHNLTLIVVNDELDLPIGQIRIGKGQGSAGHKGVESIIKELGSQDFIRIRIGIQPKEAQYQNIEKFVLQKFTDQEEKTAQQAIQKASQAITVIIHQGPEKAMTEFN